jgi:putative membrane protein
MVAWMAGLFYLPRLFVYHTKVDPHSETALLLQVMEKKLYTIIMNPAMVATLISGLMLAFIPGIVNWARPGFHLKLVCVLLLIGFHHMLNKWRRTMIDGPYPYSEQFFRIINEVPTVLLITIVICVTVKPF